MDKYIGRSVGIIYQDRKGKLSQRQILIHGIRGGKIRAYCMTSGGPRTFDVAGVLAMEPVNRHAV